MLRRTAVALMAAAGLVAGATGLASAAQPGATGGQADQARHALPATTLASQAEELGLDAGQARAMRKQVTTYLAEKAGEQIGVNRIRIPHGATLVPALPERASAASGRRRAERLPAVRAVHLRLRALPRLQRPELHRQCHRHVPVRGVLHSVVRERLVDQQPDDGDRRAVPQRRPCDPVA